MTNEERHIAVLNRMLESMDVYDSIQPTTERKKAIKAAIKALEQQPCEMTTEEYRQRMIQAFHNADTDELIAVCVLPTEKEFEHLEWLLKNHYKKAPCDDAISRKAVIEATHHCGDLQEVRGVVQQLPSVTQKYGKWIEHPEIETSTPEYLMFYECSECGDKQCFYKSDLHKKRFCNSCGAKMQEVEE